MGERLTEAQRSVMRHALGLDRKRSAPYRNRYHATVGSADAELWTDLVALGYAALVNLEGNMLLFTVTDAGRSLLKENPNG